MASISYPTKLSIPGPWLLDTENLRDLDGVIDSCLIRMRERKEELIDSVTAKKLSMHVPKELSKDDQIKRNDEIRKSVRESYPLNIEKRRAVVYMSGGRSAVGKTFEELTTVPHVKDEIPRGIALRAAIVETEIKVELSLSKYQGELDVTVASDDEDFALELFGRIENWVSEIQPKRWLQMWIRADIFSFLATFVLILLFALVIGIVITPQKGPSPVRQQAVELAKQGVNTSNEASAIQLILSLESGYEPVPAPSVQMRPDPRFWVYFAFVAAVIVTLRIPPKGAIGIWGGKRVLEWQRRWIRFVSISVPGLFVTSFFVPMLMHMLGLPN